MEDNKQSSQQTPSQEFKEIKQIKPNRNYLKISLPLAGIFVLVGVVFFTANTVLQQQQDTRSRASSSNLLSNPGCESGTQFFKPYQATIGTTTSNPHSGTYACRISAASGSYYDMETFQSYPNPTVGQTFSGSAWVRADSNTGGKVWLSLRESGGPTPNHSAYGAPVYLTNQWQLVTNTMTVKSSGRTSFDWYVVQDPGYPGQTFYADDMTFQTGNLPAPTATPAPVTPVPTSAPTGAPTATKTPTASPTPAGSGTLVFTVNKTNYSRTDNITVYWSNIPNPTSHDWIGLYTPTAANGAEIGWIYVNCTQSATVAVASGSCTFPIPSTAPAGSLELRLHSNDSTNVLIKSPLFNLVDSATPTTVAPTSTVVPTTALTLVPTATKAPTPTTAPTAIAPTNTTMPTPTLAPNSTSLAVNLFLHGLGRGGDSVNAGGTGNMSPLHTQRPVTVDVYDVQNQLVVSKTANVTFNPTSGNFTGNIDLGSQFASGLFTVKVKADHYLRGLVGGIQTITQGQSTTLPSTTLVAGDVNGDNAINIVDYNIIVGCYSDLLPPVSCNATTKLQSDLNDDGNVNQFDYNLFIRELTNLGGQ